MPHPFSRYRLRLFGDFVRIVLAPTLVFGSALAMCRIRLGLSTPIAWLAFVSTASYARVVHRDYTQRREAQQRGSALPVEVVGRWPGNIDILIKLGKSVLTSYPGSFYLSLFEEYQCTTLNLKLLWSDLIITMDEEHIKHILATGFNHFWRGRRQKERMETFLGDGIFNRDDEEWKKHRALARPFFARDRIADFDLFEKYGGATLTILRGLAARGAPVDVQDLFSRFTLDAAAEFLFGERLDTLHGALPVAGQAVLGTKGAATADAFGAFVQAFEAAQNIITLRQVRGYFWPVREVLADKVEPHAAVISAFLEPIVQRTLDRKKKMREAGVSPSAEHDTFLDYLADHTEDSKVIRDQLLNILMAGRDTTACLLTYVTYAMAMYPDIARKMREEVLKICGHDAPNFEKLKALRYVHAVINETLRVFPPVPINVRETREHGVVLPPSDPTYAPPPTPIYIPGSTVVMYLPVLTQRNSALWGDDADVFDPERWLDARLRRFTENPMMYTPFSGGPRICIGQNYARNEATYLLVRLLQQFDGVALAPEAQPAGSLPPPQWKHGAGRASEERIWPAYAITLFVKGGLWVRFRQASDEE
ncbi:cytochrome P450 [Phanerochaete sordida]|uniref:Cytochrome P450 n=1 Tax=Phanerochaete sordida TaxID=48140 RepID=A0A9P3GI69_9APHY|nr:cytochrome P450 [Phanerochaete sordida]